MRNYADIQVTQRGVQSTTCDGCGKFAQGEPEDWVHLTCGHEDWGNDSIDSQEDRDACSGACLLKVLDEIVKDYGEQPHPTLSVWMGGLPYGILHDLVSKESER